MVVGSRLHNIKFVICPQNALCHSISFYIELEYCCPYMKRSTKQITHIHFRFSQYLGYLHTTVTVTYSIVAPRVRGSLTREITVATVRRILYRSRTPVLLRVSGEVWTEVSQSQQYDSKDIHAHTVRGAFNRSLRDI